MIEERTKTIELSSTRRVADRDYTELTLVAPKVGWRLKAERELRNGTHDEAMSKYHIEMITKCGNVPARLVEELFEAEFVEALTFISSFSGTPETPADKEETSRTIEFPELTVEGRAYSQLVLYPTKMGARRQAEGHTRNGRHPEALTRYAVALVAKSAAVDERVILALDDDIFFDAWSFVGSFLPGGPAITTA